MIERIIALNDDPSISNLPISAAQGQIHTDVPEGYKNSHYIAYVGNEYGHLIAGASPKSNEAEKVDEIILNLSGATTIVLEITDGNAFRIEGLTYTGIDHNPIDVKTMNRQLLLRQENDNAVNMSISYKLILPRGKRIVIHGGLVNLSGDIEAESLKVKCGQLNVNAKLSVKGVTTIEAGLANLNIDFERCGGLNVSGGNVSGNITVPQGTRVSAPTKHWQPLKVYEAPIHFGQ